MISVVVPVYDEAQTLVSLFEEVGDAMLGLQQPWEILFVDDGSSDETPRILRELAGKADNVRVLTLRRNYGQTAALMAGIDHAAGEIVVVMDGDGQNDPADIPALLDELARGYDVVSGWRRDVWRFMYKNRLEGLHWAVLEQDRLVLETMAADARSHENLYQHDTGLARVRRILEEEAKAQTEALAAVRKRAPEIPRTAAKHLKEQQQ